MSDIILDAIKDFLYERQRPKKGRLDGTLYVCKGHLNIKENTVINKSIFPYYIIIEKYRGIDEEIYYTLYKNSDNSLIRNKTNCESHFYKKPIGALNCIIALLQSLNEHLFTLIIQGNCMSNYIVRVDITELEFVEGFFYLNMILTNILNQYEYTDFKHHQYFNKIIK